MIKCGDSTSDPDHGKDRSDSDAYQVMRKDKTNRDCQTDIKKVETIFGKSYAFVVEIGDCLNNSIILTGVGAAMSLNMRIIPNPGDGIVQAI